MYGLHCGAQNSNLHERYPTPVLQTKQRNFRRSEARKRKQSDMTSELRDKVQLLFLRHSLQIATKGTVGRNWTVRTPRRDRRFDQEVRILKPKRCVSVETNKIESKRPYCVQL
jgi:hypothetical protein